MLWEFFELQQKRNFELQKSLIICLQLDPNIDDLIIRAN